MKIKDFPLFFFFLFFVSVKSDSRTVNAAESIIFCDDNNECKTKVTFEAFLTLPEDTITIQSSKESGSEKATITFQNMELLFEGGSAETQFSADPIFSDIYDVLCNPVIVPSVEEQCAAVDSRSINTPGIRKPILNVNPISFLGPCFGCYMLVVDTEECYTIFRRLEMKLVGLRLKYNGIQYTVGSNFTKIGDLMVSLSESSREAGIIQYAAVVTLNGSTYLIPEQNINARDEHRAALLGSWDQDNMTVQDWLDTKTISTFNEKRNSFQRKNAVTRLPEFVSSRNPKLFPVFDSEPGTIIGEAFIRAKDHSFVRVGKSSFPVVFESDQKDLGKQGLSVIICSKEGFICPCHATLGSSNFHENECYNRTFRVWGKLSDSDAVEKLVVDGRWGFKKLRKDAGSQIQKFQYVAPASGQVRLAFSSDQLFPINRVTNCVPNVHYPFIIGEKSITMKVSTTKDNCVCNIVSTGSGETQTKTQTLRLNTNMTFVGIPQDHSFGTFTCHTNTIHWTIQNGVDVTGKTGYQADVTLLNNLGQDSYNPGGISALFKELGKWFSNLSIGGKIMSIIFSTLTFLVVLLVMYLTIKKIIHSMKRKRELKKREENRKINDERVKAKKKRIKEKQKDV